ncbi:MAG: ABC transporter substrate-binding protein [bacterium]|nr:ABC transporter substrate-binding protein [bacterium]
MNLEEQKSRLKRLLPTKEETLLTLKSFSKHERGIFLALAVFFAVASLYFFATLNAFVSVEVPSYGGELSEGIIGTPRFVNPVLAVSDADRDVTALVYSGLMRKRPDGALVPDLAESYEVSPDGLTYTFVLKEDVRFHDDEPVTADDVEFTVTRVKDPLIKSPKRGAWEGVSVQKVDDRTLKFILKQKYFPFLENTTLGVLPKHLWKDLPPEQFSLSDFNIDGIGSGPYFIREIHKNSSGIPDWYELRAFKEYALGRPFIDTITLRFYPNQGELITAFDNGIVDGIHSIDGREAAMLKESGYRVEKAPLPRVFALFFNQNENQLFTDKAVRRALSVAVGKERIINQVLYGYGTAIATPLPDMVPLKGPLRIADNRYEEARKILTDAGWTEDESGMMVKKSKKEAHPLKFSISTGDVEELKEAARLLKEDFEHIGAEVELKVFDTGDLNQTVIRPRKYDALFFGEIVGFDADPFPFWHSSQRNDPGLNVALYTNAKADKILEELRATLDPSLRAEKYRAFEQQIEADVPAIFVYAPDFVYLVEKSLGGLSLGHITAPADRFLGVTDWYVKTDTVWKPLSRFATR